VTEALLNGKPVVLSHPDSLSSASYRNLAASLEILKSDTAEVPTEPNWGPGPLNSLEGFGEPVAIGTQESERVLSFQF
jgi:hypothetical protein